MLATAVRPDFNEYELLNRGAEWLADFLRQLIHDTAELAQPMIEMLANAIAELKTEWFQLLALCGTHSAQKIEESASEKSLADEVLEFITKLSTSRVEHQKLDQILSALTTDFFSGNTDIGQFEGYELILEAALKEMTIFGLMSAMVAKPGSRHAGTNPTYHTARVVCEWLKAATTRFDKDSTPEQKSQFRAELLAALTHDFGKVLDPKSDAHHKLSFQLAGPGIKHVAKNQAFGEEAARANFLVDNHDICGHIAAKRRSYHDMVMAISQEPNKANYMRSLFYIQLADMQAITTMPEEHKNENLTIWAMLCTDLGCTELVTEIIGRFPHFAEILNRRIAVV